MTSESPSLLQKPRLALGGMTKRGLLLLFVIIAATAALFWFAFQVASNMSILRSSPQDNVHWSIAQLDVELLAVDIAARESSQAVPASLAQLRQRFDVFYSRVQTTAAMPLFREAGSRANSQLQDMKARLDLLVPIIDLPNDALSARVDEIRAGLEDLRPLVRQVTLLGVKVYAEESDATRGNFATLLERTALFNAFLLLALGATTLILVRQMRISRRRADALQISSDRNASTLLTALDAIIILDMSGKIVEFNPAATSIFGYSRNAAVGTSFADLIIPERNRPEHLAGIERLKVTGDPKAFGAGRIEMMALRSDGKEFPVEFSVGITNSPEGKLVIAYLRDISSRLEQERQLRNARDEALDAARAKSQFLAVMSHEMRTPLNGVMAILDLLEATPLTEKQQTYVDTAVMSADVLKQHVDDVLDITRIQAGKLELFPRSFNLVELLEEVQAINVAAASRNGNRIVLHVDLPTPYFIADRKRIHQLLTNLVGNAIKFTQNGRIDIHANSLSVKSDVVMFEFSVSDTGIGIEEKNQEKIFEDFVTIDASYQRNTSGAGLGLAICKNIVEAMNGTIGVESRIGEGSKFWFRIPLKASFSAQQEKPNLRSRRTVQKAVAGLNVLVIEDNETNRFVAREMLEAAKCVVSLAQDGEEGVRLAAAKQFDLILMDLSMPRLNGWDASLRIREDLHSKSRLVPIYALTAHALPQEQADLQKAGMQGCLLKPLRTRHLDELLKSIRENSIGLKPDQEFFVKPTSNFSAGVDLRTLDELRDVLGQELFRQKIAQFESEVQVGCTRLGDLMKKKAWQELAQFAHRLAGSSSVFGAAALHQALVAIENAAKQKKQKEVKAGLTEMKNQAQDFLSTVSAHLAI